MAGREIVVVMGASTWQSGWNFRIGWMRDKKSAEAGRRTFLRRRSRLRGNVSPAVRAGIAKQEEKNGHAAQQSARHAPMDAGRAAPVGEYGPFWSAGRREPP